MTAPDARRAASTVCVYLAGALGDFLLALPALQALRSACPGARIDLAGNAGWLPLALASGAVDRTLSLDALPLHLGFQDSLPTGHDLHRFLSRYDLILSWFGDREGHWERTLRQAGGGVVHVFPFHRRTDFDGHVSGYFLDTLRRAGIDLTKAAGRPPWPAARLWNPDRVRRLLPQRFGEDEPGLCIHPGSGSPSKNWPQENFLQVALETGRRWGLPAVVLLGEAEEQQLSFWRKAETRQVRLKSGLNLPEVSDTLRRALLYLGNDSGISHLAASLGVPTLALFGPTDPVKWSPLGPRVRVLQEGIPCRPGGEHRNCLHQLGTAEVIEALAGMLAREFPELRPRPGDA